MGVLAQSTGSHNVRCTSCLTPVISPLRYNVYINTLHIVLANDNQPNPKTHDPCNT